MKVAVIGAGLIGQAWAIVFARGGCQVRLWDGDSAALTRAFKLVEQQIKELENKQLLSDAAGVIARIHTASSLEEALDGAGYVQENLPERLDVKQDIFGAMDRLSPPDTPLASSTSSIPASAFTENLSGRHRCLVSHPVNPPYLIPVVELCGAPWTDAATLERTRDLMKKVGQKPVTLHKELEGFVLNRLQGALLREAFRLVESGCVSAEDLDITVKDGLGLRWSFMGPFETIDLNAPDGVQDYCKRYGDMYESIAKEQTGTGPWSPELVANIDQQRRELLPSSELLNRRIWRDERLMALLLHKKQADAD
ncbi:3-hydroxybutyryl-CoA dehydrogenase [Pusillimonas sp. T7-7]|uniref:3-hydroxyacyl-CoA dehydrogenase n=1 Tax=Pusillimonas sp. (strain T7-7) TaxID=1007105 RepID=UPI0002084EC6|nr:3-hydroxyacyl-CoA dehydrogenase [Pusillimonas sp. T7-7]AEC18923.1 3-hydroxybutyryl-CoA dehydrogenase [Pusillimonas sp. T7-7]